MTRDQAAKQADRINACPAMAPKTKQGGAEIVDCIMRCCSDEDHARLVVTQLLDTVQRFQSLTAEIAIIAHTTRKQQPLPEGCDLCHNAYWVDEPGFLSVFARCTCARGRALRNLDSNE